MKKTIGRLSPRASEKKRTDSKKFGGGGRAKTEDDILLSGMTKQFNDKIHYGHPQCGFHMGHDKLSLMILKHCQWRFATVKHHKLSLLSSAMTFSSV